MNTPSSCSGLFRAVLGVCFGFVCFLLHAAEPVSFEFKVTSDGQNPFTREISAEVNLPSGKTLNLPAFYAGKNRYAVRARAEMKGEYGLGKITETTGDQLVVLPLNVVGRRNKNVREIETRPAIGVDGSAPGQFVFATGERFVPVGANLAWADKRGVRFYDEAFGAFSRAGLNWSRVWMAHWGGLNLDWLTDEMGRSPLDGTLDLRVADRWDKLVTLAETKGIYLQIVLQHHGQYSSKVNPSWNENPWNAANPGGFLKTPAEFFTSPQAQRLTMQKYRTIVARWGYSPAVMAWELFNEVHWVDAMRGETRDEAAVARWHTKMAAYIRSLDRYGHLVTTSTEDLQSPIYADMDYFQPHLYAPNMLAGVRHLAAEPASLSHPIFYGEVGDDNMPLAEVEKKSGVAIVPPVWAGLMGQGQYPSQPWLGRELMETERLPELGAVARFVSATGLGRRSGLMSFSPVAECATRIPFTLVGGQLWKRSSSPEIIVPVDGREPIEFATIPRIFVSAPESKENGYPNRATYRFDFPKPVTLRLQIADTGAAAGAINVSVDGAVVVDMSWPERPKDETDKAPHPQPEILVPIAAGLHAVVVENSGATGWFDLARMDLDLETPILAAIGQRGDGFVAVWLWHRTGVFSIKPTLPAEGVLVLDDIPAGTWRVIWWDTLKGTPAVPVAIVHGGGPLRLSTPPVSRHAAVVLERQAP